MATASHSVAPTAPWLRTQTLRPKRFRAKVDILPELRQLAVVRLDGLLRLIWRKYELSDPECQDALTALRPAVTAGPVPTATNEFPYQANIWRSCGDE